MANSNWKKEDAGRTSSSREESGAIEGAGAKGDNQGDGFENGNARQGGLSGAGSGGDRDKGLDKSREPKGDESDTSNRSGGMGGSSGTAGMGGESSTKEGSGAGGVEGTSPRGGGSDPDRTSQT